MSEDLISKKDLLLKYGISYGALYRWKRKGLIPDEWFIRRSTPIGQETFFRRDAICERIDEIIRLRDEENIPLDDMEQIFYPSDAKEKRRLIINGKYGVREFDFSEIISVAVANGEDKAEVFDLIKEVLR